MTEKQIKKLRALAAAYKVALEYDSCPDEETAAAYPKENLTNFTSEECQQGAKLCYGFYPGDIVNEIIRNISELSAQNVYGIEITEEELERFGFKESSPSYILAVEQTHWLELLYTDGYWYPSYAELPEFINQPEQRVSLNRIKYLHQLQNLYYALTGVELKQDH